MEAEVLRGFNERLVLHEPEYQLPGAAKALCDLEAERAISIHLFHRSRAVLNDLRFLRSKVRRLGVAAPPLKAPPSLVAIGAAAGNLNFYKSAETQQLLKHAGFKRGKVYPETLFRGSSAVDVESRETPISAG